MPVARPYDDGGRTRSVARVLVVDADTAVRNMLSEMLRATHCEVVFAESSERVKEMEMVLENCHFELMLVELSDSAQKCFRWLSLTKRISLETEVIFLASVNDMDLWVEAIQSGAYEYLPNTLEREELEQVVINAVESHRVA